MLGLRFRQAENTGVAARRSGTRKAGEAAGSEQRRDAILAAAARRFAEFGFGATTVRQIADDVNILSGSLYHHFATKEEMLHEVVREAALAQQARAERVSRMEGDAETKIAALVASELEALSKDIEAYSVIFNERKFFRRSADFQYVTQARKASFEAWRAILRQGIESGQFHDGIDLYLTISTIMRMLNTAADWYRHEDGSALDAMANYSLEALVSFYTGFLLRSVRAPERAGTQLPGALPIV